MHVQIDNTTIQNFGANISQEEIDEMKRLVKPVGIMEIFRDKNELFGNDSTVIHIDARDIGDKHKIDVQRKKGDKATIGIAFVSYEVNSEIGKYIPGDGNYEKAIDNLYKNLKHALELSMTDIFKEQQAGRKGTSRKFIVIP